MQLSHQLVLENLRSYFNSLLSFENFTYKTVASTMYHALSLADNRDHLPRQLASRLRISLDVSRLEYFSTIGGSEKIFVPCSVLVSN